MTVKYQLQSIYKVLKPICIDNSLVTLNCGCHLFCTEGCLCDQLAILVHFIFELVWLAVILVKIFLYISLLRDVHVHYTFLC